MSKKQITLKSVSINQHAVRIPADMLPKSDGGRYTASDKGSKNKKRANITRRKIYNPTSHKTKDVALYIRKNQVYRVERATGEAVYTATARLGIKTSVIKNHDAHRNMPKVKV